MAKTFLDKFPFNASLNEALKEQFGAKFDGTNKLWFVSSKAKAEPANALIKRVVEFEANKREGVSKPGKVFSENHMDYLQLHPLTGKEWSYIRAELWARAHGRDEKVAAAEMLAVRESVEG